MIELYVNNQTVRMYTPVIAADSLHYLTGVCHFDSTWDGYNKWVHFTQGSTVYDILLTDGAWNESAELNLTIGEWSIYITGVKDSARLTTVPVIVTVKESGLIDAPLHVMPMSVAEQIDTAAQTALAFATEVRNAALNGDFNGRDGTSFVIKGFFDTYAEMIEEITAPVAGEAYGVGTAAPYDIYIWDTVNNAWKNNGPIQGAQGQTGPAGATFTPYVDAQGNISWTNDGGKTNPQAQNIRGPQGETGEPGEDGEGPYEAAVDAGYTGTEETFMAALIAIPYHNARHLPTGADPITVQTDNLASKCVTAAKIADGTITGTQLHANAVSNLYTATITTTWTAEGEDSSAPYSQDITVSGLLTTDTPIIDIVPSSTYTDAQNQMDAWAEIYKFSVSAANTLTVYANSETDTAIPIQILCIRR